MWKAPHGEGRERRAVACRLAAPITHSVLHLAPLDKASGSAETLVVLRAGSSVRAPQWEVLHPAEPLPGPSTVPGSRLLLACP